MKMFSRFILGVIILSIPFIAQEYNTYTDTKDQLVEVVEKYSGTSTGKYATLQFIAVYKTDTGAYFDRDLTPAEFYQTKVGEKIVLKLGEKDIHPVFGKALLSALITTVTWVGGLFFGGVLILGSFSWRIRYKFF